MDRPQRMEKDHRCKSLKPLFAHLRRWKDTQYQPRSQWSTFGGLYVSWSVSSCEFETAVQRSTWNHSSADVFVSHEVPPRQTNFLWNDGQNRRAHADFSLRRARILKKETWWLPRPDIDMSTAGFSDVMPYRLVCRYGKIEAVNPRFGCRRVSSLGSGTTRSDSVSAQTRYITNNCSVSATPDRLPTLDETVQAVTISRLTVGRYVIMPVSPLNRTKSIVGARGCAPP